MLYNPRSLHTREEEKIRTQEKLINKNNRKEKIKTVVAKRLRLFFSNHPSSSSFYQHHSLQPPNSTITKTTPTSKPSA
jgi:hypothetical protein